MTLSYIRGVMGKGGATRLPSADYSSKQNSEGGRAFSH